MEERTVAIDSHKLNYDNDPLCKQRGISIFENIRWIPGIKKMKEWISSVKIKIQYLRDYKLTEW